MANYYVKPASIGGDDGNDGSTFALAKATLNAAYALASAGDTVYICSDASNPFVDITLYTNGARGVNFVGGDTTDGTPYTGTSRAVISATGTSNLITGGASDGYSCRFYNISLQGVSTTNGFYKAAATFGYVFVNCEFKNLQYGAYIYQSSTGYDVSCDFYNCVFDSCTHGVRTVSYGGTYYTHFNAVNCLFKSCSYGINLNNGASSTYRIGSYSANLDGCRFVGNFVGLYAEDGFIFSINRCVFYNNSSHGISLDGELPKLNMCNTIFHSNGGYAISNVIASTINIIGFVDYNCYYNNTSGIVNANVNGGTTPGSHNVTSNPLFVSLEPGSEDFRLQASSPCLSVGVGYTQGQ